MYPFRIVLLLMLLVFSGVASSGPVNINTADAQTLSSALKGVGPVKAQAIVEYREKHGSFPSIDAITNVKGIGEIIVRENKGNMSIDTENE